MSEETLRHEEDASAPVRELARRLYREQVLEVEPPHRFLIAALVSFGAFVLALASSALG